LPTFAYYSPKHFPRNACTPTSNAYITNIGLTKFTKYTCILTNRLYEATKYQWKKTISSTKYNIERQLRKTVKPVSKFSIAYQKTSITCLLDRILPEVAVGVRSDLWRFGNLLCTFVALTFSLIGVLARTWRRGNGYGQTVPSVDVDD